MPPPEVLNYANMFSSKCLFFQLLNLDAFCWQGLGNGSSSVTVFITTRGLLHQLVLSIDTVVSCPEEFKIYHSTQQKQQRKEEEEVEINSIQSSFSYTCLDLVIITVGPFLPLIQYPLPLLDYNYHLSQPALPFL